MTLIGVIISFYNYMDFQLRRMLEALDYGNIVEVKYKGKSGSLNMYQVTNAILTAPDWSDENVVAFRKIEEFRTARNLVAHFVIKRFPEDDAFIFLTKSANDYRQAFGKDPPPGVALTAVIAADQLRQLAHALEGLQCWLVEAANEIEKQHVRTTSPHPPQPSNPNAKF